MKHLLDEIIEGANNGFLIAVKVIVIVVLLSFIFYCGET